MAKIYQGYLVVMGCFVLSALTLGAFFVSSLYIDSLKVTFADTSPSTLAFFTTIQIVVGQVASLGGSPLMAFCSSKGINTQMQFTIFAGGLMSFGLLWASFANSVYSLLFGVAFLGVGVGMGGFVSVGICTLWFNANRGTMLLLALAGRGLGSLGFSSLISGLINYYAEAGYEDPWRPTMQTHAVLCLVLGTIASMALRLPLPGEVDEHEMVVASDSKYGATDEEKATMRKTVKKKRSSTAQTLANVQQMRMSFAATADDKIDAKRKSKKGRRAMRTSIAEFDALAMSPLNLEEIGSDEDLPEFLRADKPTESFSSVLMSRPSVCMNIWMLLISFAFLNFQVHLPTYALQEGLPPGTGSSALGLFGVGLLLGYFTLGPITDFVGARNTLILGTVMMAAVDFAWPHLSTVSMLKISAAVYGYFASTQGSHPLIIIADALQTSPPTHLLMLNGVINMAKIPGFLLGPNLAGSMAVASGDYKSASLFSAYMSLAACFFLFLIPVPKYGDEDEDDETKPLTQIEE